MLYTQLEANFAFTYTTHTSKINKKRFNPLSEIRLHGYHLFRYLRAPRTQIPKGLVIHTKHII